jgi:hypothetical protein
MSRSSIVDESYRLKPGDLGRRPVRVAVQNVSFQGLEELHPVLHFAEFPTKRLVLDPLQCRQLITATHSPLCVDWIGRAVELRSASYAGQAVVAIEVTETLPKRPGRKLNWETQDSPARTVMLLLLLLALAFGTVYILDHYPQIVTLLQHVQGR